MALAISDSHWYALQVRPNCEMAVSRQLKELRVEEYLPIHRGSRGSHKSRANGGPPLFPGYVFSFLNLQSGPRLYTIPGIVRILGYGRRATPIEDHEIAMVRSIAECPLPVEPVPYFMPGEKISLTGGPLKGISGTFLRSAKGNKLVVSVPLLMRSLAVTVLADWVIVG